MTRTFNDCGEWRVPSQACLPLAGGGLKAADGHAVAGQVTCLRDVLSRSAWPSADAEASVSCHGTREVLDMEHTVDGELSEGLK